MHIIELNDTCETGDISLVGDMLSKGIVPDTSTLTSALYSRSLDITILILSTIDKLELHEAMLNIVCEVSSIELCILILLIGVKPARDTLNDACFYSTDNSQLVQLILSVGAQTDKYTLNYAIRGDRIDVLQLILALRSNPISDIEDYSYVRNNIDMIILLRAIGARAIYY